LIGIFGSRFNKIGNAMMPEMDCVTMIQHLKRMVQTCHIPIIMLKTKIIQKDREAE